MKNKKIYLYWSDNYKEFCPTGMMDDENIRYVPKQGYGVCEIASWLSTELQHSSTGLSVRRKWKLKVLLKIQKEFQIQRDGKEFLLAV
ncbi:hypothetical protein [Candidatus Schmidhempelia bombi]|uniref:hypothetical protein n=1 Tax=Candidatus Schmidhempelia bombi TaxID=1505866 RepID=UPI001416EE89|nr:hypothetical protein [Candidatus Schmidhempelia bombi]